MSAGLLRLTRSGPAIVVLSINRCHSVTQCCEAPSSFISFVYPFLSFACRFFPHLFCSGLGQSVFFFPQDPLGFCRLFVAMDTPSASSRSSDLFIVENAGRLQCMERFPDPDLSLVELTSSTRRWIAEQRETSTRSPSADLLCDALSTLLRVHRTSSSSKALDDSDVWIVFLFLVYLSLC